MKTDKRTRRSRTTRSVGRGCVQRVVSVPRGYKRVAAQMDAIYRQFVDGASLTRLSRKHSLPKSTVEFVIRMEMQRHANEKAER